MRLIDADTLNERLQSLAYDDWNQGITTSFSDACHEIIDIIEEQPTIEPERKKGTWRMQVSPKKEYYGHWECNQCGVASWEQTNFCSNCGCEMVRREKE